jgi:hypothetical protein
VGLADLDDRYLTIHKAYPQRHRDRAIREIAAYQALPWATPKLDCSGENWLEMERCTPLLELLPGQTVKYRDPLRELVKAVHDAGWWHCDLQLGNVVVHPVRGVLLIDWENARPASSEVSYDLYGARAAGVIDEVQHRPDGVWWGGPLDTCPGRYWSDSRLVELEHIP